MHNSIKTDIYLLRGICFIFILLFLSSCYESLSNMLKFLAICVAILCFIRISFYHRFKSFEVYYLLTILFFLIFQFIYTSIVYNQSPILFFNASFYFLFVCLLPVFSQINQNLGYARILLALEKTALIISVFMIIAAILTNFLGLNITEVTRTRMGLLRINAPFLVQLAPIISIFFLLKKTSKCYLNLLTLICSICAIVYVYQSRLPILLLIVCTFVLILINSKGKGASFYISGCLIGLFLLYLFSFGPMGKILDSFSTEGQFGGSTLTRMYEIEYYLSIFRSHWINGTGLLSYHSSFYSIISGPYGNYYIDDVGIIGALTEIGLWIIPIYIIPLGFLVKRIAKEPTLGVLGWSIFFYILGTSFTTLIVFPYFDPIWPLILTIFIQKQYCITPDNPAVYTRKL